MLGSNVGCIVGAIEGSGVGFGVGCGVDGRSGVSVGEFCRAVGYGVGFSIMFRAGGSGNGAVVGLKDGCWVGGDVGGSGFVCGFQKNHGVGNLCR